ncbi:AAA family ATPase [Streptomyces sp. NPDC059999]|uniref:AAA family ATPase n=1 Tax=Streptomyces sp. NPDC059999 TaxID=3347030 RepID=UPI0036A9D8DD
MVRSLVSGAGDFPARVIGEDAQLDGETAFDALPAVGPALRELASALERVGVVPAGAVLLEGDKAAFSCGWEELQETSAPSEPLVVHFAGHGTVTEGGHLYLITSGADADRLPRTAVNVRSLLDDAAPPSRRPVLLMLDVCGAGQAVALQQLDDLAGRRSQDQPRTVWIIAACASEKITYGARFTTAIAEILHQLADGDLDINPALPYIPITTLASAIDRHLARIDSEAGRPRQRIIHTPQLLAFDDDQPAFFANPSHTSDPRTGLLAAMNPLLREFALGCAPGLDPLHFATRAAGNLTMNAVHFSGRHSQLARIQNWIDRHASDGPGMMVVTGGPGSGKSALLGVVACLTHPRLEPIGDLVAGAVEHFDPRQPAVILAAHARQLSLQQITQSLLRQLREQQPADGHDRREPGDIHPPHDAATAGTELELLLQELEGTEDVLIVLDALDETIDPRAVCEELLIPLASAAPGHPGCRVLLGTRPWWDILALVRTHLDDHPESELDLDPANEEDRRVLADDLNRYMRRLLPRRYPRAATKLIADRLAQHSDSGAFLVANLYADHLRATFAADDPARSASQEPPTTITQVFDMHTRTLADGDPWVDSVLTAVGQGHGDGIPLEVVHHLALAHQPPSPGRAVPQLADTRRALRKTAFYLRTTPGPDQRLHYRYFHQSLTDHTRPRTTPIAVHHALLATVPTTSAGTRNWELADPYLLRHAATHAHAAGSPALDDLLEEAAFLIHADPDTLTAHLHHATIEPARLSAHIYRTTTAHHPARRQPQVRRSLLALDAAGWRNPELASALARTPVDGTPLLTVPLWATRHTAHSARLHTLTGHGEWLRAVQTLPLDDGTALAVTASHDSTVKVWNPVTGELLRTLDGHRDVVTAVATALTREGMPLAITASKDGSAAVWNLCDGRLLHTLGGHDGPVTTVAITTTPTGMLLAVTGSYDRTAKIWNPMSGELLHTLTGHTDGITALALTTTPDSAFAVTAGKDRTIRVWDALTGGQLHMLPGLSEGITAMSAVTASAQPLVIGTGYDGTAIVWDLRTGERLHTLTGHTAMARSVATATTADGTVLGITTGMDHTAIVWNLLSGERLHTLTGHTEPVTRVATTTTRANALLAITISMDATARVWNLHTGKRLHTLTGHTDWIQAVATGITPDGVPFAITAGHDRTAIVWSLLTGEQLHAQAGHTQPIRDLATTRTPDGNLLAVTASNDRTAIVWNPLSGERLHTLAGHAGRVAAVETITDQNGIPHALTAVSDGTASIWNLVSGTRLHTLTSQDGLSTVVATARTWDGTPLALTADTNRTAIVWNALTGERLHILAGHSGNVLALATTSTPNGDPLAITAGEDSQAIVWNPVSGERLHTLSGHTSFLDAVATVVTPTGPLAVTASRGDRYALVWNALTGERLHTLAGHLRGIQALATAVTSDGTALVVTTSSDRTAIVWNLETGRQLQTLTGLTDWALAVVTTEDGRLLVVTAGKGDTIVIRDLRDGRVLCRCHLPLSASTMCVASQGVLVGHGSDAAYFAFDFS